MDEGKREKVRQGDITHLQCHTDTWAHRDACGERHTKRDGHTERGTDTHRQTHMERKAPGNREAGSISQRHTAHPRKCQLMSGQSLLLKQPGTLSPCPAPVSARETGWGGGS